MRTGGREDDNVIAVMPKDKLEVIKLNSLAAVQEMEERDEVEYVERGEFYWIISPGDKCSLYLEIAANFEDCLQTTRYTCNSRLAMRTFRMVSIW